MNRMPQLGDIVTVPKGNSGHVNICHGKQMRIIHIGEEIHATHDGIPFVWCQLYDPRAGVIASHQLGYTIPKQEGFKK